MIYTIIIEKGLEMRQVNCSIVEGGKEGAAFIAGQSLSLRIAVAVATFRTSNRETFDAISSRCPCSTFQREKLPEKYV